MEPSHARRGYRLAGSAAILRTGGLDVIRKEAWPFYRTSSGVHLCWQLEEPKGPKRKGGLGRAVWREPGSPSVTYLVMQNGNLEYGERRCGFNLKHQSTKAPKHQSTCGRVHLWWALSKPGGSKGVITYAPFEDHPLDARCEPSALKGWIPEILDYISGKNRTFLRILST